MTSDLDRPDDPTHPWLIRKRARVILVERLLVFFILLLALFILTLLIADYLQGRAARQEIIDCQVESGECFQRNQKQVAEVLAQIERTNIRSMIVVVKCARSTATDPEFDLCVVRGLKEAK